MTDVVVGVNRGRWRARLLRWLAELLLVFLGAYAAFWLNGFQQHRQDMKRRDQILAALEEYVQLMAGQSEKNGAAWEKRAAEFDRALQAGEMPPVKPISFATDYSATDINTFLQAGGLELLDAKTFMAIRNADAVTRDFLSEVQHDVKLSDEVIVPNLGKGKEVFYDPATKQLRPPFDRYPAALHVYADYFKRMAQAYRALLDQLEVERRHR